MVNPRSVERYQPGPTPQDRRFFEIWIGQELGRIAGMLSQLVNPQLDLQYVEPTKREIGMTAYADGTNWDPGSGEGMYVYTSGGWRKCSDPV